MTDISIPFGADVKEIIGDALAPTLLFLNGIVDSGISTGAGMARKYAFKRIQGSFKDPLSNSHTLLEAVHKARWQAAHEVLKDVRRDWGPHRGHGSDLETIEQLIKGQLENRPGRGKDARDIEVDRAGAGAWIRACLNLVNQPAQPAPTSHKTNQALLQAIPLYFSRDPEYQHPERTQRAAALQRASDSLFCDLLLCEIAMLMAQYWDYSATIATKTTAPEEALARLQDRRENTGTPEFLTQFKDPNRGWAATFRVLMKAKLDDPDNDHIFKRTTLAVVSELHDVSIDTNRLVNGLEDRLEQLVTQIRESSDDLKKVLEALRPEIRLETFGVNARNWRERKIGIEHFVFRQRATDLTGRESELEKLQQFLDTKEPVAWWQIAGDAGQGKSRLALDLILEVREFWHAGFLRADDLLKTNWATVAISRPTLIVIDYVAAPQKARMVREALLKLIDRSKKSDAERLAYPVRILLLERKGYAFEGQESIGWFSVFIDDARFIGDIRATAYKGKDDEESTPLYLKPMPASKLVEIAQSWTATRGRLPLSDEQCEQLKEALAGGSEITDQGLPRNERAWRPLFTMLLAELLGSGKTLSIDSQLDNLGKILEQERQEFWKDEAGNKVVPPEKSTYLACLATMVGELLPTHQYLHGLSGDFYDIRDDSTRQKTWLCLGRVVSEIPPIRLPFLAREPDLMGEYFVLETLDKDVALEGKDASRILRDAWEINKVNLLGFMIRLIQDFKDHLVTTYLAEHEFLRNPENEGNLEFDLLYSAYFGLTGAVSACLNDGADANYIQDLSGTFPLLMAAQNGHAQVVEMLLKANPPANVNAVNETNGTFPLLQAAQEGHVQVVEMLLKANPLANVNAVNEANGIFPLLQAAQNGHVQVVEMLLKANPPANVNAVNEANGTFPLLQAAQNGHVQVVEMLLKANPPANVNAVNETSGTFPLLQAAQNGHVQVVEMLLKANPPANVNAIHKTKGAFPLLQAAQNGHVQVVEMLLKANPPANVNAVNETSGTFPLLQAAQNGHVQVVEILLNANPPANVNAVHKTKGAFPLLQAAQQGHVQVVEILLNADPPANVNAINETSGTFPLLLAAQEGHVQVVEILLNADLPADANQIDPIDGTFPLLMAAQNGHVQVVEMLLKANPPADANQIDPIDGGFPLLMAAQNGHVQVVEMLLKANPPADANQIDPIDGGFPLLMAAQNGHVQVVEILLNANPPANVNAVHKTKGAFPLLQAAQQGHVQVVEILLNADPPANVNAVNETSGTFPLLQAAQEGHVQVVEMLLKANPPANVNAVNEISGTFPLLLAAQEGHVQVVEMLLNADPPANANAVNETSGTFPLLQAAQEGHVQVVEMLLKANPPANVNAVNEISGTFPLLLAAQEGHVQVVEMLLNADPPANANAVNETSGTFPLLQAAQEGHVQVVEMLLNANPPANVNAVNETNGAFPLLMVAINGHQDIVKLLLAHDADPHQQCPASGKDGVFITALDVAESLEHEEVSQLLRLAMEGED